MQNFQLGLRCDAAEFCVQHVVLNSQLGAVGCTIQLNDSCSRVEMQIDAGRLDQVTPALLASGVRIVIDHFGRFDPALGMGDPGFAHLISLGQTRRVWVKGSAAYRVSAKPGDAEATSATAASAWAVLLPAFGVDRLLWGTDWPHTQFEQVCDPRRAINELHRLVIDASHRQAVLIDTPAELFHFR